MRPGTRSGAQSYKPLSDDNRNGGYASSPPEGLGIECDGEEAVRLQRLEESQYNQYSPGSSLRPQFMNTDLPRRTPHQTSLQMRQSLLEENSIAVEEISSPSPRSLNKPNLRDGRVRIRPRGFSLVSLVLACLSVALLGLVAHSFLNLQRDPKGCKMSFMYPSYAKLTGFDTEHTRFATKYSLYLYREQNKDLSMEPNGIPVLFIPGNAGSYRQVRPIAAEAASQFFNAYQQNISILQDGIRNLDFFTVDFNEDFSAFHGQTLLDQAEYLNEAVSYILSLYHETRRAPHDVGLPDPQSVIILGHSMGGVVARAMLTMPNYLPNSINTIITMAAPHALPPAPFDWEMERIYNTVNGYWRKAYAAKWANNNPLWHVTLISIAGGGLDNTVASDYAATSSIVPMTNGFTVYTSTVPGVWTGMDHQAILWCDQFRKVVARSLLEVVDVRRPTQTKSRAERMQVFRKLYLTGLEDNLQKPLPYESPVTILKVGDSPHRNLQLGERLRIPLLGDGLTSNSKIHLLPVPPEKSHPWPSSFSLLTDQNLTLSTGSGIDVLFCNILPLDAKQNTGWQLQYPDTPSHLETATLAGVSQANIDATTRLACKDASMDAIILPASTPQTAYPFSGETFSYLQYDLPSLGEHQFVAVIEHPKEVPRGFVVAEFYHTDAAKVQANISTSGLLTQGLRQRFSVGRAVTTKLNIPSLESSLLTYKLQVSTNNCQEQLFRPFVRQSIAEPYESKYFVNVREADINLHGLAPYLVPQIRRNGAIPGQGVTLQFWTDPICDSPLDVRISFDFMGSFGKTVMRYRVALAAFPLAIVALCLRRQFTEYNNGGYFINFDDSLLLVIRDSLPILILVVSVSSVWLSAIQRPEVSPFILNRRALEAFDRIRGVQIDSPRRNDMLLGLREPSLWFLAPLCVLVCVGVIIVVSKVAFIVTVAVTALWNKIPSFPWLGAVQWLDRSVPWFSGVFRWIGSWWANDSRAHNSGNVSASNPTKRRILVTLVLLFIVATVVPFQFAYVIACVVQFSNCIKALNRSMEIRNERRTDKSVKAWSFFNYSHSLLILMIWLLPINIPVLLVWVRNLQVAWLTPFSSHHNVLSIAPFILLVETVTSHQMIPRQNCYCKSITSVLFLILCTYAIFYGVMYAYLLHYLTNLVAAWLVLIHFSSVWHQRGQPIKALFALFGNGETKKQP